MPKTYSDLPVQVVRDEEQGFYLFGVELDGAFVQFAIAKLGHVDTLVENAREAAATAQPSADVPPAQ